MSLTNNFPITITEIQDEFDAEGLILSAQEASLSIPVLMGDFLGQSSNLYNFSSFTFTNGTQTGRFGPSRTNLLSSYNTTANPWLSNTSFFNVSGGIQLWTVPVNGTYRIEVWGAQGGQGQHRGGYGARMRGDFALVQGQVIKILVGQSGTNYTSSGASGGGGTFVSSLENTPIIVAGGGGGGNSNGVGRNAVTGTSGTTPGGNSGVRGTNGGGGGAAISGSGGTRTTNGQNTTSARGSGGGGFYTHGGSAHSQTTYGGRSFVSGGLGGTSALSTAHVDGGFGGGGGNGARAGGGGGYSGGGGGGNNNDSGLNYGGGGGSYNTGTSQSNSSGVRSGHGQVTITLL